jgi:large subunit ribosomal protein L17
MVFSLLQNKEIVTELFTSVSEKIADRPGGYTRILRTGFRLGDNAEMCIIELVDYNENMLKEKAVKKAARTRRSSVKKEVVDAPVATEETPAAE